MGKTEKIVVLSVLSLVVVLFVWSLGGGDGTTASERGATYGQDDRTTASAAPGAESARLRRGEPSTAEEESHEGGLLHSELSDPGAGGSELSGVEDIESSMGALPDAFSLPTFASSELERGGPAETSRAVHMRPGWDIVTTIGLSSTVNPDLLTYEVQPGDTWTSIARDLYGQESKSALLRHNNEGLDEPEGTINVPAKDELGALGEARIVEVLRGETLWGVAKRTLGSGPRWIDIYEANKDVVPDPNYVAPGTVLTIPAELEAR